MSVCRRHFEIFCQSRDRIEDQRSWAREAVSAKLMVGEGLIKLTKATFDDRLGRFECSFRARTHYNIRRLLRICTYRRQNLTNRWLIRARRNLPSTLLWSS